MTQVLGFTEWTFTAACEFAAFYGMGLGVRGDDELIHLDRTRPGERVAKRRRCKTKVGASHRINRAETIKWFKNRFEGIVRGDRT